MKDSKTRDKIKEVALRSFNIKGYAATTVRDIVNELDITPASIYFYFQSKEELYIELVKETSTQLRLYLENAITLNKCTNIEEILHILFNYKIKFYLENKDAYMFLVRSVFFETEKFKGTMSSKYLNWNRDLYNNLIQNSSGKHDLKNMKDLLNSYTVFTMSYIMQLNCYDNPDAAINCETAWNSFWNGAKAYL